MIQENKELLLKDLSARLPYGVIVKTPYNNARLEGLTNRKSVIKGLEYVDVITDKQTYPIRYIKPYLRPLSNMTEEEKEEIENITQRTYNVTQEGNIVSSEFRDAACFTSQNDAVTIIDWINTHHFDYRGLIPKGLALEAPKGMYE